MLGSQRSSCHDQTNHNSGVGPEFPQILAAFFPVFPVFLGDWTSPTIFFGDRQNFASFSGSLPPHPSFWRTLRSFARPTEGLWNEPNCYKFYFRRYQICTFEIPLAPVAQSRWRNGAHPPSALNHTKLVVLITLLRNKSQLLSSVIESLHQENPLSVFNKNSTLKRLEMDIGIMEIKIVNVRF